MILRVLDFVFVMGAERLFIIVKDLGGFWCESALFSDRCLSVHWALCDGARRVINLSMCNHTWPGHGQLPQLAATLARIMKIRFPQWLCGHGLCGSSAEHHQPEAQLQRLQNASRGGQAKPFEMATFARSNPSSLKMASRRLQSSTSQFGSQDGPTMAPMAP